MSASQHEVTLITRAGCHLCDDAHGILRRLRDELGFDYREVDVDSVEALRAEYSDRVPVVLLDGREHGYWRVEERRLREALGRDPEPWGTGGAVAPPAVPRRAWLRRRRRHTA